MRVALLLLPLVCSVSLVASPSLMPLPARVTTGQGALSVTQGFRTALSGYREARLEAAVTRMLRRLSLETGIPLDTSLTAETSGAALLVRCARAGAPVQELREDESYRLTVTSRQATLAAETPLGILRGLQTFLELVELGPSGFAVPAVEIEDAPRLPWRGLMLDVARHWLGPEVVKRTLDAMEALKLNVFHWHLSDDQGFRIESKRFPQLQKMGSDGLYFTQEQVRDIIRYAHDRGIRVVPEFDMPGHTTSWLAAMPELAAAPGPYHVERAWGVFDPCLDPTRESVYRFLDSFIGEMAGLFPDPYFHVGGDEVNGKQWDASPHVREFRRTHNLRTVADLQSYFTRRVQEIVARHGKKMIGWDEILHPDLPHDIVVQSWRGQKSLAEAARQGFRGILSAGYYLDLMQPASQHYLVDPLEGDAAGLNPEERQRILGGEACLWAEYVTPENVDQRLWPRVAAIAERLWSPEGVRDVGDMYRRLDVVSRNLQWLGLEHVSAYERMLNRLAGRHPVSPVRTLAEVVEPVKEYAREAARRYTSVTPLNRLVDTARPESRAAREFGDAVDRFLASRAGREEIRRRLETWRDNDARLAPIMRDSALLQEAEPLSKNLSEVAAAGLEALALLASGRNASANWTAEKNALLERAARPQAELLLSVVPPVRKLVEAAR